MRRRWTSIGNGSSGGRSDRVSSRRWQNTVEKITGDYYYETCLATTAEYSPECTALDQICLRQTPDLIGLEFVYPRLNTRQTKLPKGLDDAIYWALNEPGPVVVDVWVDKAEDVLTVVRPGQRVSDMIEP